MKCYTCKEYQKGKGTKKCLGCDEFSSLFTRAKPCVSYVKIPREVLEALSTTMTVDYLAPLTNQEATIILQLYRLDMTGKEVAEYHNISQPRVNYIKKSSLLKITTYILNNLS